LPPEVCVCVESTPLTSFVVMSLVHAPRTEESEAVIHAGARFLVNSVREDGSWPIDTNLATWVSTLATNALHTDPDFRFSENERAKLRDWLLDQEHRGRQPNPAAVPAAGAPTDQQAGAQDEE